MNDTINIVMNNAANASVFFSRLHHKERIRLMQRIGIALQEHESVLLNIANKETNLPLPRLKTELDRTILQWNQYAEGLNNNEILGIVKDPGSAPGNIDILKMNIGLGPVVVFGASNFPFAYSTPGGDVASAFAAGCPVIVKEHPAHKETSRLCANIIIDTLKSEHLPEGIFQHVEDQGFETGADLVKHPSTAAVAFTGSFKGGKALYDLAQKRENPIPVFAEMGSTNPVILMPHAVSGNHEKIAAALVGSLCASAGQFCTNPGIWFALEEEGFEELRFSLKKAIAEQEPTLMLHKGIAENYHKGRKKALETQYVELLSEEQETENELLAVPTISIVPAGKFIENRMLREEIFGPYAILVKCGNVQDLFSALQVLDGQLTGSIHAVPADENYVPELLQVLSEKCGRLIYNGVPTGVAVTRAMHHGGPFPATTDSRFTAVGADAIRRFMRPLCFQGWPQHLLPEALQMP